MDIEGKTQRLKIYENGIKIGSELWVSRCPGNGLYKVDLEKKVISFIDRFPEKQNGKLFSDVFYDSATNLFFAPLMAEKLAIYNMEKNGVYSIECKQAPEIRYSFGIEDSGYIYLFPQSVGDIVKMRIVDSKIEYMHNLVSYLAERFPCEVQNFYAHYLYKGRLYLPLTENSVLVEYDYINDEFEIYSIDVIDNIGIYNCIGIDEELYLLDRYGGVYYFNIETKEMERIVSFKDETLLPYSFIVVYNDEIWLIPYVKDKIIIYNMITKKSLYLDIIPDEKKEKRYKKIFYDNETIWLYPNETESLIEIDMKTRKMQGYKLSFDNTLQDFIEKLPSIEKKGKMHINGEKIYQAIMIS